MRVDVVQLSEVLPPCPRCGELPLVVRDMETKEHVIACPPCRLSTLPHPSLLKTARSWGDICQMVVKPDGD